VIIPIHGIINLRYKAQNIAARINEHVTSHRSPGPIALIFTINIFQLFLKRITWSTIMIAQSIEINVFNFVHRFSRFLKLKHCMRSLCKIIRFHVILARHGYVILFLYKINDKFKYLCIKNVRQRNFILTV